MGKHETTIDDDIQERCCLRDTSLRFQPNQRTMSNDSPPPTINKLSPVQETKTSQIDISEKSSINISQNNSRKNSATTLSILTSL